MKLSETIQALLQEYAGRPLPLGALLGQTGEQGFGMVSGLLILPMLIPIPVPLVGLAALFGSGIVLMGGQLALGFHKPWLPQRLARLELSPALSQGLLKNLNRVLRPIERLSTTRLLRLSRNPVLRRLLGLCLAWNALLMALPLPIPLTNLFPAYTILILAISVLEEDGLLLLVGFGLTVATTLFFASITGAIWVLLLRLRQSLLQF